MQRLWLRRFYLLRKIHKRRSNVTGRPVISNNGTATECLIVPWFLSEDNYSDKPYILKDTRQFLSQLNQRRDIPKNTLLLTLHVLGLYPHIPHKERLETMKRYLGKWEDQSDSDAR